MTYFALFSSTPIPPETQNDVKEEEEETKKFILKVHVDEGQRIIDVPVTPESTCLDVIQCVKEPGDEECYISELWRGCERTVADFEKPFEILQEWGEHREEVKFFLRYYPPVAMVTETDESRRQRQRNGMRDGLPGGGQEFRLPGGVDLTLSELQDMAARQQQQIESQQQILVAKEQRLKYLKQQEQRQQKLASENERLKKLRDTVEAQEMKLKKLRALRGQVEQYKANNGNLNSELEAIKSLFNEKEKELALAVAKVEDMTRQLEEIRSGKVKANANHQTATAAELEKLKKELMIRNKLNEQQNTKLSQQRQILKQRKEESQKMDNRIHELQMRLKKKRALQEERSKNQVIQPNINHKIPPGHRQPPNIVAVEPYVQHAPKESIAEDVQNKPGFGKENPKYQSLPPSSKFMFSEKGKGDESSKLREENHVGGDQTRKKLEPDKGDDYNVPLVVSVGSNSGKPIQNGISSSSSSSSSIPSPTDRTQSQHRAGVPQAMQNVPGHSQASGQLPKYPPPVPSRTGLSYLAPRPFGSTYSTSILTNRNVMDQQQQQPMVSVQEDARVGGSGQSSPASSEGSLKENSNSGARTNVLPTSKPNDTNLFNQSGPSSSQSVPNRTKGNNRNYPQSVEQNGSSKPNSAVGNYSSQLPPRSVSQLNIQQKSSVPTSSSSQRTQVNSVTDSVSGVQENSNKQKGTSSANSIPPVTHSGFSNLNHASALGAVAHGHGHRPLPTYRYASKSVIDNMYLGKMQSEALEKYQQEVASYFRDISNTDKSDTGQGSQSQKSQEKDSGSNLGQEAGSDQSSPLSSASSTSPSSPVRQPPPYPFPMTPPHADIASDKVSYKPNTPKNIRRRHSDSDNEEITKAVHQYDKISSASKPMIPMPVQENQLLMLENNNGAIEIQATSFSDRIPETVLLDNRGNVIEVNDNSKVSEQSENKDINDNSVSSIENVSSSDIKTDSVLSKKKSNLKGSNSKKNGGRVSFDPLALLLDASLEGELELVMRCAKQVPNVSASNDEGITALHNAICAGHYNIVKFLVEFGCDVNSPDSDGWTPLHCAASCNNLPMVKFLVEHGACIFATTISDHETAAEKCEEDEDGYDGCSEYLYSIQEKLGIMNGGAVFAVFDYEAQNSDELDLHIGDKLTVLRKGDEHEKEWWWSKIVDTEGYVPRNLLGLYPRVLPHSEMNPEV